ncbi:hypothetical protein BDB00DRAFT_847681 [Zychaea mexicana]|uniref:uncharacterized protein n=1 Tax=Zychaea mexicana TaxID=64656 RepID=UPI0022FF1FB6|nr:uncharacterized protein BDB00DRAFT_847681 [Zychaea mexicana]KAI9488539.1 hypothetical protein BDB00DRAFT_847681 [Zychaea mexicana]
MTRIGFFAITAAALTALQGVSAHYQLTYPESRGFDEAREPLAPCGGFDSVSNRSEFPLKGGFMQINSGHTDYTYEVKVVTDNANPSTDDFNSGTTVAKGSRPYPAEACLPVDLSSVSNASAGTNATLQITYNGGDGTLYQCADVTLTENPSSFNSSRCVNADGSDPTASSSADGSSSDENGASAGVRAAVGGVFAAAIAAAFTISA